MGYGGFRMQITFQFNSDKALQAVAYFLSCAQGPLDKAKLMKLVYLADRASFIARGIPITGDRHYAMKLGPVPSDTLHLIDGEYFPVNQSVYNYIHLDNYSVSLTRNPGEDLLSEFERGVLTAIWKEHGRKKTIPLCRETHALPEYAETFIEGTSTLIPYEKIAQHSGNPARFWKGRPVISVEMAEQIPSPFAPETDL